MKVWMVLALSGIAFLVLVFAFYLSVKVYELSIYFDAHRELDSRVELASRTLEEPLRTLDFAAIRAFGESSRLRGYELSIRTGSQGLVFDTRRENRVDSTEFWIASSAHCGEYELSLLRDRKEVFAPYNRMYRVFTLAVLVGASGMFLVFFVLYRQRVRIRELAKLERFRREFIADVSHEIKTPLTGILGAVEMMGEGGGGQGKVLISLIKKEAGRLNGLVQSILDLARLEREGDALNRTEFDLAEMLKDLAEKYGIRHDCSQGGSTIVFADAELVRQALSNLVENAKKYSGTDDISLALTHPDGRMQVTVEDHGVGIPSEHAARVFERFYRVDAARSAETGGAGLGACNCPSHRRVAWWSGDAGRGEASWLQI